MEHLDHATNLFKALFQIRAEASKGGDLTIKTVTTHNFIGHDVNIKKVRHIKDN